MEEVMAAKEGNNQAEVCVKSDRSLKKNQQHTEELLKIQQLEQTGGENDDTNEWEDVDESELGEYGWCT
jgi:hypothetical protein